MGIVYLERCWVSIGRQVEVLAPGSCFWLKEHSASRASPGLVGWAPLLWRNERPPGSTPPAWARPRSPRRDAHETRVKWPGEAGEHSLTSAMRGFVKTKVI